MVEQLLHYQIITDKMGIFLLKVSKWGKMKYFKLVWSVCGMLSLTLTKKSSFESVDDKLVITPFGPTFVCCTKTILD